MGCCNGEQKDGEEQEQRSRAIDRTLEEDAERLQRKCDILLLGMRGSGKSTILKQMKIIHSCGFSTEELAMYRSAMYWNIRRCAANIVQAIRDFDIEVESAKNKEYCDYIMECALDPDHTVPLEHDLVEAITAVWNDSCISKVLEHANEFYLMDSAQYFLDEIKRISAPDYLPTERDVLRSPRMINTGISEVRFSMGELRIRLFDFSHLRGERKKWIHCFENVAFIIYSVPLSEYDRLLDGPSSSNVLMEALLLFESIVDSRLFQQTSIILFLNKVDILKRKLQRSPFVNYFPDYLGGNDVNGVAKYFLGRFDRLNRAHLLLYPHLTEATDARNIRHAFDVVKETILQTAMNDTMLQL